MTPLRSHRPLTRKRRRLYLLMAALVTLGVAMALILSAFEDHLVFFYSPTDLVEKEVPSDRIIRIGGLVEKGSIERRADGEIVFGVTDLAKSVRVTYRGILPDLFREEQGVVAQGLFGSDGIFEAREVLARHDETYMPREVADALKRSGQWKPDAPDTEAASEGSTP